jgi:hypothetical protein
MLAKKCLENPFQDSCVACIKENEVLGKCQSQKTKKYISFLSNNLKKSTP